MFIYDSLLFKYNQCFIQYINLVPMRRADRLLLLFFSAPVYDGVALAPAASLASERYMGLNDGDSLVSE